MIRGKAARGVIEDRRYYVNTMGRLCHVCGLGAVLVGKYNGDYHKAEIEFEKAGGFNGDSDEPAIFAMLLQIPRPLAIAIELKHINGMPIQQIAAWLKSSEGGEDAK
jgi:hypothetical protein